MTGTSSVTATFLGLCWGAWVLAAPVKVPAPPPKPEFVVQIGHQDVVTAVAYSPDGKWIATASWDNTACLWDARTGMELRRFEGHSRPVEGVVFSADGKQLLTVSRDGSTRLWDARTGKEVRRFQGHTGEVWCCAISPDGKHIATGGMDFTVRLWDAVSGKPLHVLRVARWFFRVKALAFSPDGKSLLTGSLDFRARLWNVKDGTLRSTFLKAGTAQSVAAVAFSPDGKTLLTGSEDGNAVLWDAATGKEGRTLAHAKQLQAAAFSPDGKRVLTAGSGISLWDARTGILLRRFDLLPRQGGSRSITSAAFSPDGKQIVTGVLDRYACLWDVETGVELGRLQGEAAAVAAVAVSPDGKRILCGGEDKIVHLWDATTGQEVRRFEGHQERISSVAFSPDGTWVISGSWDGSIRLWDMRTGTERWRHRDSGVMVKTVAFAPNGKYVAAGTAGYALLCDAGTGKKVRELSIPGPIQEGDGIVAAVAFSPDSKYVLRAATARLRLWDVASGKNLRTWGDWKQDTPGWKSIVYSPDGKHILWGSGDGSVHLWEASSGKEVRVFKGHADPVGNSLSLPVAWSADGKYLLSGGDDRTVRLWDAATGKERLVFKGHALPVQAVAFFPDGKRVLSGSADHTVRIWDARTGKELCRLVPSRHGFVAADPDTGSYIASRAGLGSVGFRVGERMLPFDQFDLKFNRPDRVLARLGLAAPETIAACEHACRRRLRRMGFSEEKLGDDLPELTVSAPARMVTDNRKVQFKVRATDAKHRLNRVFVFVNGVPVPSRNGIDLGMPRPQVWEKELSVELSSGKNVIQLSALNDQWVESLRENLRVLCRAKAPKPTLYMVAVGVSKYADRRLDLTYADKDAKDLAAYFASRKGKSFAEVKVLRLLNKEATREKILAARKLLEKAGLDDQVVLFFAGHGLLDSKLDYYFATTDIDFKNPAKRGLSYEAIAGLLDGLRARKKLLLVDTCHAGEADEDELGLAKAVKVAEGTVRARSFRGLEFLPEQRPTVAAARQMEQEFFADLRRGSGAAVIASSAAAECALESDAWNNGVFTYAVLAGLKNSRAYRDGDGRVTVKELRRFVIAEVRRLTRGRQSPAARAENFAFDFSVD